MTNNNFWTTTKSLHLTTPNVKTKHNVLTTGSETLEHSFIGYIGVGLVARR